MKKISYVLIVMCLLMCSVSSATAQVSIGINLPLFPELVRVPGYPVYYAPQINANYFFYDGMYWVYENDNWYASSWYNGPWEFVEPEVVPLFILRIPVRYYRQPPVYFRGWQSNAPPLWGQHWGRDWEHRRSGWDKWNRRSAPAAAPLPIYQRQYSGDRYPRGEQQHTLHSRQYRYQPRDKVIRQHFKQHVEYSAPAPAQHNRQQKPAIRSPKQQDIPHTAPLHQGVPSGPRSQAPQRGGEQVRKQGPAYAPSQQQAPAVHKQQRAPRQQEKGEAQGGYRQEQRNNDDHGQGRNR